MLDVKQMLSPSPKPQWTKLQERLLQVLQVEENREKTIREICELAGYTYKVVWYRAIQDSSFVNAVEALGVKVQREIYQVSSARYTASLFRLKETQQRIWEVLQNEENHRKPLHELYILAKCSLGAWNKAFEDEYFTARVEEEFSWASKRRKKSEHHLQHIDVTIAVNIEEELAKDVWDTRRLKSDYPKHCSPGELIVNFAWIANTLLRQQIKQYFRLRLPKWKAKTFVNTLLDMKPLLSSLPPDIHIGNLERMHIEAFLPLLSQFSGRQQHKCLRGCKVMFEYMAKSPAWTGPRPPRFLIWPEDIPSEPNTLPRPIPPDVLDQLDPLIDQAVEAMKQEQIPPHLAPIYWDAILILRHTGMRFEDLAHLRVPDEHGRGGCLDQDPDGYWWIRIHHAITKMAKDHRIPTRESDGVVEAIRRQCQRVKGIPNHFGEHHLFRTEKGVLARTDFKSALRRLAPHLLHEEKPYLMTGHQFRHTIATDMIEQGVDIYTVKEFLGHASLTMTQKYVAVYLESLKAKYDAYRLKKQQTYASEMMATQIQVTQQESDTDGGWLEGKVGKLYRSPLPDGIGNCVHLPMHDGCPDSPHCPTCPKLQAGKRHLPVWENKAKNLLITVDALRANPAYERARQKHEQELQHAEKVIKTIKEEGFWDGRIHNKTNKS